MKGVLVGTRTMYDEIAGVFRFPHKEARYNLFGVTLCELYKKHDKVRLRVWRDGSKYGVCGRDGRPDKTVVLTAAEPNPQQHSVDQLTAYCWYLDEAAILPQAERCFGYWEGDRMTGVIYKYELGRLHCLTTLNSRLPKVFPVVDPDRPDYDLFWKLFKQGKLVDVTALVDKGQLISKGDTHVLHVGEEYYACLESNPKARANPDEWFNKNHASAVALEGLEKKVRSEAAKA